MNCTGLRSRFRYTIPMRYALAVFCVILGASIPGTGEACSCEARTVAEIYDKAQVLALVRVGAEVPLVEADGKPYRTWPYQLIDTYKGQLAADWLWTWVRETSCDTRLEKDAYYLLSTNDDGHVDSCDARRLLADPAVDGEIKVLNAFMAGAIPVLTQPWEFAEGKNGCRLSHRFSFGRGDLQFYFEPGLMSLFVNYPFNEYLVEGTGRVVIGKREWPTRRSLAEAPWASIYETVDEKDALEILAQLDDASSIAIAWEMQGLPEHWARIWPAYPAGTAETAYLFLGDAAERFGACVARRVPDDPTR